MLETVQTVRPQHPLTKVTELRIRAKNNPNDISLSESQNSSVVVSAMRIKSKTKVDYGRILSRFAKWLLENKPEAMDEDNLKKMYWLDKNNLKLILPSMCAVKLRRTLILKESRV